MPSFLYAADSAMTVAESVGDFAFSQRVGFAHYMLISHKYQNQTRPAAYGILPVV